MKFAHDFDASLRKEEYPQAWLQSAIQYRQLKKCIKKVQQELHNLGLEPEILDQLWQGTDDERKGDPAKPRTGQSSYRTYSYRILIGCSTFKPKLTFALHPRDGSPVDAWLSPKTSDFLRRLSRSQSAKRQICASVKSLPTEDGLQLESLPTPQGRSSLAKDSFDSTDTLETIEISLTSDLEFFQRLQQELRDLNQLQRAEEQRLATEITSLGGYLTALMQSTSRKSTAEINFWRELFCTYIESQIFFSTVERDAEPQSSAVAQKRLQGFYSTIVERVGKKRSMTPRGDGAAHSFLQINFSLLQFLKFQEVNRIALFKILKKFEKRTALHAQATSGLPLMLTQEAFITQTLAKAACSTIQDRLLPIVPQLDDYLCPICFGISYKPVRLRCDHVFCIACLLVMQKAQQNHCPLCRGAVVMEASPEHLDTRLMTFLLSKFPSEVKAKQKANERAVGLDLYGGEPGKCAIM